jgi:hypothetical protein
MLALNLSQCTQQEQTAESDLPAEVPRQSPYYGAIRHEDVVVVCQSHPLIGIGRQRMMTSVSTSEYACAKNMVFFGLLGSNSQRFPDGRHSTMFAIKNPTVHILTTKIMNADERLNHRADDFAKMRR